MSDSMRRRILKLLLLGLVCATVATGAWLSWGIRVWAAHRLRHVDVPIYPQAEGVYRAVISRSSVILLVQYTAPVGYPSKAVLEFYDEVLLSQGWVRLIPPSGAGGSRDWEEARWHEQAPDSEEPRVARRSMVLAAMWTHRQRKLTLDVLIDAVPGTAGQRVVVNVLAQVRATGSMGTGDVCSAGGQGLAVLR